jgi:hypothetical protein
MNRLSLLGHVRTARPARRRSRSRLASELLEDRCVPATFVVNSLLDTPLNQIAPGQVTLRSAVAQANAAPSGSVFNTIMLSRVGDYAITQPPGTVPGVNNSGAFAIVPNGGVIMVEIVNATGGTVTIDGGGLDRIFDINPANAPVNNIESSVIFQGVTLVNGFAHPGDQAGGSGGAIRVQGNVSLALGNCTLSNNSATADGGGIAMVNPPASTQLLLQIVGCTISYNRAGGAGGGLETDGTGRINIINSTIRGNVCTNQGGGIWLDAIGNGSAALNVTSTQIDSNQALTGVGGGIGNAGNGGVFIVSSTLANNFSGSAGGGFDDANGLGTFVAYISTFANNSAAAQGGGIAVSSTTNTTTLDNCTVTGNQSLGNTSTPGAGGGILSASGAVTINNSVIAGNSSGPANLTGGVAPNLDAAATGQGNFVGSGDAHLTGITNGTQNNQVGTLARPLNPLLGPLQNNGGTTLTELPAAGSPLLNKGVNAVIPTGVTTDQRLSVPRIVNGTVDIGAVERQNNHQTVGVFDPATGTWYLRNSNSLGPPDAGQFAYGAPGWFALVGDWTGDGQTGPAVVDPKTETWYIRNTNRPGAPDFTPFQFGAPGWVPLAGDWTGTGHYGIGVFDPTTATFYLRNSVSAGGADFIFKYGAPGWRPVVGDWAGTGKWGVAVIDPTTETWYVRNTASAGPTDYTPFAFGAAGWTPVAGDWTGLGHFGIGVFSPSGTWNLRNTVSPGRLDISPFAYGAGTWTPLAGTWMFPQHQDAPGEGPGAAAIDQGTLDDAVQAALTRLADDGVAPAVVQQLAAASFQVSALPPGTLGLTNTNTNTVQISATAAGYGWFVDPTPLQDEEFDAGGFALPGTAAAGHEDLLTVVLHEMGHLVGLPDDSGPALMARVLNPGVRHTQALDQVFASGNYSTAVCQGV